MFDYLAPQFAVDLTNATKDTALYPRDILTSMMFNKFISFVLPDGKVLYPMTSLVEVSKALDAITQTQGKIIIRGEQYWEAVNPSAGGAISTIVDEFITSPTAIWESPDLTDYSLIWVMMVDITTSTNSQRVIQVRLEGDIDYLNGPSDYRIQNANGDDTGFRAIYPHANVSASARSTHAVLLGTNGSAPSPYQCPARGQVGMIWAQSKPIAQLRIYPEISLAPNGNLTGGRIVIFGM